MFRVKRRADAWSRRLFAEAAGVAIPAARIGILVSLMLRNGAVLLQLEYGRIVAHVAASATPNAMCRRCFASALTCDPQQQETYEVEYTSAEAAVQLTDCDE